jgi:hypothetical protein
LDILREKRQFAQSKETEDFSVMPLDKASDEKEEEFDYYVLEEQHPLVQQALDDDYVADDQFRSQSADSQDENRESFEGNDYPEEEDDYGVQEYHSDQEYDLTERVPKQKQLPMEKDEGLDFF